VHAKFSRKIMRNHPATRIKDTKMSRGLGRSD
jgi:hypothetical protein